MALLVAPLCHGTSLRWILRTLAEHVRLPEPVPEHPNAQGVRLCDELRPVLRALERGGGEITPARMLHALIEADAGRRCLGAVGLGDEAVGALVRSLAGMAEAHPALPADP